MAREKQDTQVYNPRSHTYVRRNKITGQFEKVQKEPFKDVPMENK